MKEQPKSGSLTRVSEELSNSSHSSIYTLGHWASSHQLTKRSSSRQRCPAHTHLHHSFSISWLPVWRLLASKQSQHHKHSQACYKFTNRRRRKAQHQLKKVIKKPEPGLLDNIADLPDRRFFNILKYVFRRWLTWTNIFELVLIIILTSCLVYHCHGLLNDYYNYPSFVSQSKQENDNFLADLPAVTICTDNRLSQELFQNQYPQLNESHLKAMELGTFYSVDNYSISEDLSSESIELNNLFEELLQSSSTEKDEESYDYLIQPKIDTIKVVQYLSGRRIYGYKKTFPDYDLVASAVCFDIWGEPMPCANLRRIVSHQSIKKCDTLFHQSAFWDPQDSAFKELEKAMASRQVSPDSEELEPTNQGEQVNGSSRSSGAIHLEDQESGLRSGGSAREMIRLRLDFRPDDYMNKRINVAGSLSIHSNKLVASMSHISHRIEPGYWYSYFIQRTDYRRLPPPYSSACHTYLRPSSGTPVVSDQEKRTIASLAKRQATRPDKPLREYVSSLRERSISASHCMDLCEAELSAVKCNCWPTQIPYILAINDQVDENRTVRFCAHDALLAAREAASEDGPKGQSTLPGKSASTQGAAGDDIQFQVCARHFVPLCTGACPADCSLSTFDATEQLRAWPSHESLRYLRNQKLIGRLKAEARCCATVSVLYSSLTSDLYSTTPRYSGQDLVTTISGNVEAWIGLSAVHGYLFLERLYTRLLEAGLLG